MFDLAITGGKIVTDGGISTATLGIQEGKIRAILDPRARPPARARLAVDGLYILPGVIDTHVHLRDPGPPGDEDIVSGTQAAAAGGITTILLMPTSQQPVNSGDVVSLRAGAFGGKASVDFALYGGAGHQNVDAIRSQADAGVIGFKTFLHPPMPSQEEYFTGLWCTDDGVLREIMASVRETGLPHCFHCENNSILTGALRAVAAKDRTDPLAHAESRPAVAEAAAVALVLALAAETGARVHVVHTSTGLGATLIKEARARGVQATAETCPQYLFLTQKALEQHGPFAKCNPPLRGPKEVAAVWQSLLEGTIDVVGSDHVPCMPSEKLLGARNVFMAPSGFPGLESMLPLMLTASLEGRIGLPRMARIMASRAAEIFGLKGKGKIAVGFDADFTFVDPGEKWTFDCNACVSRARETMRVYHGRRMLGRVVTTMLRGVATYDNGAIVNTGHGRFLRPRAQRAARTPQQRTHKYNPH
jgi:dihydropyrimidinase/allantoinase